jgi:hypothetical protein
MRLGADMLPERARKTVESLLGRRPRKVFGRAPRARLRSPGIPVVLAVQARLPLSLLPPSFLAYAPVARDDEITEKGETLPRRRLHHRGTYLLGAHAHREETATLPNPSLETAAEARGRRSRVGQGAWRGRCAAMIPLVFCVP